MQRFRSIVACGALIAVPLIGCGGEDALEPGVLNTNRRTEDDIEWNNRVTAKRITWQLDSIQTEGDAAARRTRGSYDVAFRNFAPAPVSFRFELRFYDSANNEVGRAVGGGVSLARNEE